MKNNQNNNWMDTKVKIKAKWSKFSDSEINSFKHNLEKISASVQKAYGISKEHAEKEFNEFKKALQVKETPNKSIRNKPTPSIGASSRTKSTSKHAASGAI